MIEPSESALDNPAPGQDDKAARGVRAFDDLDGPLADFVEGGIELGAAVGAVGKDMPQPRIANTGWRSKRVVRHRDPGCRLRPP